MNEIADAFDRLLAEACPPEVVRAAESGTPPRELWGMLESSGFLDALVPSASGGAGLGLADAFALFVAEGRHAAPVPIGPTLLVRALFAAEGLATPAGSIAIADAVAIDADGSMACHATPHGLTADWIATAAPDGWQLLPTAAAQRRPTGVHGSLRADLNWPEIPANAIDVPGSIPWRDIGAALTAAQLAGAAERVLRLTLAHANDRVQFGRSIGKFQAIQHQLAVMAEHVLAAHMAAEIGCAGRGPLPDRLRAAEAEARASEAAALIANIAHAIHGAIGITAEMNLQLYTRRLHEWRSDFGAETHWNRVLGRALLQSDHRLALDFMRAHLIPPPEETGP